MPAYPVRRLSVRLTELSSSDRLANAMDSAPTTANMSACRMGMSAGSAMPAFSMPHTAHAHTATRGRRHAARGRGHAARGRGQGAGAR